MDFIKHLRLIPDFPETGILFRDITPLLSSPSIYNKIIDTYIKRYATMKLDAIAVIDSRGFIFGSPVAYALKLPLVLIRKQGKLPSKTFSHSYNLEYGNNILEIHQDAIKPNSKVVLFDDLLATGGTALAAAELIKMCKGNIVEMAFLIHLIKLEGRKILGDYLIYSLIEDGR
jgi:adenine phosphoribosyltransferase